jgi:hypothetical protein
MLEVVQRAEERGLDFGHDDQGQSLHRRHLRASHGARPTTNRSPRPGLGLKVRHIDTTESGGSSYVIHVAHAAEAIVTGKCSNATSGAAGP